MRRQRVERAGIGDFPAVKCRPLARILLDDDALFAIIHAQRQCAAAFVDKLHAEKARAVGGPLIKVFAADADIAERLQ